MEIHEPVRTRNRRKSYNHLVLLPCQLSLVKWSKTKERPTKENKFEKQHFPHKNSCRHGHVCRLFSSDCVKAIQMYVSSQKIPSSPAATLVEVVYLPRMPQQSLLKAGGSAKLVQFMTGCESHGWKLYCQKDRIRARIIDRTQSLCRCDLKRTSPTTRHYSLCPSPLQLLSSKSSHLVHYVFFCPDTAIVQNSRGFKQINRDSLSTKKH